MLPDAIDQHARCERIGLVRDGHRQLEPAAAVLERGPVRAGQDFEKTARDDVAGILSLAADEDGRVFRVRGIHECRRAGGRAGMNHLQHVALLA